jgi:ABC-2 type transport system ATP-binding protein
MAPSSGTARIFGADTVRQADAVRHKIGIVFQNLSLDVKLTVRENLCYQGHLYGLWGAELETRMDRSLELSSLVDRQHDKVETLSGGLQRRVELAKVTLHDPELVLFDEPTSGLDPGARREFWAWVRGVQERQGATVVFTSHLLEEAEQASHVLLLDHGRVVANASPEELCADLGGDILTLRDEDPEDLLKLMQEHWDLEGTLLGGLLRLEVEDGARLVGEIYQRFGSRIGSLTLGHPTLEDVFIHRTGHTFWEDET